MGKFKLRREEKKKLKLNKGKGCDSEAVSQAVGADASV